MAKLDPYERYQAKPFPGSSHTWAFKHLANLPQSSSVLDIGPGSGIIGRFLQQQGISDISAIEIDAKTREQLRDIYPILTSRMEELPSEKKYDAVILLDVLEHMADPFQFLDQLSEKLQDGALLYISVPNITHFAIRLMMLFGYFEYMDRGPLDRTHLQFFSRRRFNELTEYLSGCQVVERSGTIEPLELMLPSSIVDLPGFQTLSRVRIALMELWPSLLAYQHVGLLRFQRP
ncbi:MAG: class I SAM-dependent methyltransferase [Bdellovibrionales bacterium]|nr:class I SAM-dependent methyltransferase [Bdellovibrionales bacterium]